MSAISNLSDEELRRELVNLGFIAGPVTATTRKLYEKKLQNLHGDAISSEESVERSSQLFSQAPMKEANDLDTSVTTKISHEKQNGHAVQTLPNSNAISRWIITSGVVVVGVALAFYIGISQPQFIQLARLAIDDVISASTQHYYFTIAVVLFFLIYGGKRLLCKMSTEMSEAQQQRVEKLAERIAEVVRERGNVGIPRDDVLDRLLPSPRTDEDWRLWLDASMFIGLEDQRIITRCRSIGDQLVMCWVWAAEA